MLAALGGIFAKSGVGQVVSGFSRTSVTDRVSVRCCYGVLFRNDAFHSRNGKMHSQRLPLLLAELVYL
ncbi:hypothetical protein ACT7CZ_22205 [Bacillus cereus]